MKRYFVTTLLVLAACASHPEDKPADRAKAGLLALTERLTASGRITTKRPSEIHAEAEARERLKAVE